MLTAFDHIPQKERVIVALDCGRSEALELALQLQGTATWLKVGMTLYYAEGPAIIEIFKLMGFKVFLDLKFHDIPHQVAGATTSALSSGADMITMHSLGGFDMMTAAQRALQVHSRGNEVVSLAITVLTSMNQDAIAETGIERSLSTQVIEQAKLAQKAALHGVVASPHEARILRETLGPDAYIITPGIRPKDFVGDDQSRIATPAMAFDNGASHIVIGRPITQANNPLQAFMDITSMLT